MNLEVPGAPVIPETVDTPPVLSDARLDQLLRVAEGWEQIVGPDSNPNPHAAAIRLMRVPELAEDFLVYAASRDHGPFCEAGLARPLPGGYTVASLVGDFAFSVHGAFLVAVELALNQDIGEALLNRYIERGYRVRQADGTSYRTYPPAAERYPACSRCGMRSMRTYDPCPRCGYGRLQSLIDAGTVPPEIMEWLETRRERKQ